MLASMGPLTLKGPVCRVAEKPLESERTKANVALSSWIWLPPNEYRVVPRLPATLVAPVVHGMGARALKLIWSMVAPFASTPPACTSAVIHFGHATRAVALAI